MKSKGSVGETLNIVLAVVGIMLLLYLLVSLYGVFIEKGKVEQAKGTLNEINGVLKTFDSAKKNTVLVLNPRDWYLFGVLKEDTEARANCRVGENCICFCSKKPGGCGLESSCLVVDKKVSICSEISDCISKENAFVSTKKLLELKLELQGEEYFFVKVESEE